MILMLIVLIDHCRDYDLDDDKDTVRIGEIGDQSMITEWAQMRTFYLSLDSLVAIISS